jgi:hypothetical protein
VALDSGIAVHGVNGSNINVGAVLTDDSGAPVSGATLAFSLGTSGITATTDTHGHATASMQLTAAGDDPLTVSFAGDANRAGATSPTLTITVDKQPTNLALSRAAAGSYIATLTGATGQPLAGQTVTLVSAATSGAVLAATPASTNGDGVAQFAAGAVPSATATLTAYFGDANTPVPGGTSDQRSVAFAASRSLSLRPGLIGLTDSTAGTSRFGARVNFTVSVGTRSASSTAPTGSVRLTVDGTLVSTIALTAPGGTPVVNPSVATTALLPGSHTISASYSGDGNFLPATQSVTHVVTCDTTYTGVVKGNLNLTGSGKAVCLLNAKVAGSVKVGTGVAVAMVGSSTGPLGVLAVGSGQIMVCGSRVEGAMAIQNASSLVVVGDPGHSQCAPNTILAGVVLDNDTHGVEVIGNTTLLVVARNIGGPGPYPGDVTTISGNHR